MFLTHVDAALRQFGEHLFEAFNARTRSFGAQGGRYSRHVDQSFSEPPQYRSAYGDVCA